jgi:hypothetical protein
VVGVLQRIRTRNLPERVDDDLLRLAGVPDAALYRVRAAIRFLGFVDDEGRPSDTLRALAAAPDEQYRELLAGAIREAYRDDFSRIDPGQDTQAQIVNAFRPYQPRSQTNRMVMLFLSLCREAGISVLDAPRERNMRAPGAPRRSTRATSRGSEQPTRTPSATETRPTPIRQEQQRQSGDLLFGLLSQDDVAAMDKDEFKVVWDSLGVAFGTVARARAKAKAEAAEEEQRAQDAAAAPAATEEPRGESEG